MALGVLYDCSGLLVRISREHTPVRAIAVEAYASRKYHRVASFLGSCFEQDIKTWQVADVAIGGPGALSDRQLAIINKTEFRGTPPIFHVTARC
ncbi:hypothetical protein BV20DRAFT_972646 [Pilatotrama ljubarskyi]|nr:hypothetical protein BV20DRAFT_972646 [Pilatotrama ljubarskyi]